MKNSWSAYVIVAAVSVVVAIAIAGTPTSRRTEPTIAVPETVATTTTVPSPSSTVPPVDSTSTTTTLPPPETSTTLVTTTTEPAIDRATVAVVAVNGASVAGLATRVSEELAEIGFVDTRPTDGTTIVDETVVYFFPGFEREAELVALDLGIDATTIAPVADAPSFGQLSADQVAVYLGLDRSEIATN